MRQLFLDKGIEADCGDVIDITGLGAKHQSVSCQPMLRLWRCHSLGW